MTHRTHRYRDQFENIPLDFRVVRCGVRNLAHWLIKIQFNRGNQLINPIKCNVCTQLIPANHTNCDGHNILGINWSWWRGCGMETPKRKSLLCTERRGSWHLCKHSPPWVNLDSDLMTVTTQQMSHPKCCRCNINNVASLSESKAADKPMWTLL